MNPNGIIALILKFACIGINIVEYILLIRHIARWQHACSHAGQNLKFGTHRAAAEGAGNHAAAVVFRKNPAVIGNRVLCKAHVFQRGRVPEGFRKNHNDIGILKICAASFVRLILCKCLFQISLAVIIRVTHV